MTIEWSAMGYSVSLPSTLNIVTGFCLVFELARWRAESRGRDDFVAELSNAWLPRAQRVDEDARESARPAAIGDRRGKLTWVNAAARMLLGDVVGRRFSSLVAPEDRALVERELERKLRGASVTDYEVDILTADGRRRRVEISSVPIEGGDACHALFGVVLMGAPRPARPLTQLTPRQNEVLRLLGEGASTAEIAATLHLSKETVRNHVRGVLGALAAHSRLEAVLTAHREGLLANWEEQRSA
jgi:PAS domain S-box-containing protein